MPRAVSRGRRVCVVEVLRRAYGGRGGVGWWGGSYGGRGRSAGVPRAEETRGVGKPICAARRGSTDLVGHSVRDHQAHLNGERSAPFGTRSIGGSFPA